MSALQGLHIVSEPAVFQVGNLKFSALGERVLIQEDEFRSGYECRECNGTGKAECPKCAGKGASAVVKDAKCAPCLGTGKVVCSTCDGKGGLIAVPEVSQRRPSSGVIVSVGEKCKLLKVGDSVLYSNFAGHAVDLGKTENPIVIRILHETEVLCRLEGHLELRITRDRRETVTL